eukprot:11247229-Alexandrium_andersonii.AAC.1
MEARVGVHAGVYHAEAPEGRAHALAWAQMRSAHALASAHMRSGAAKRRREKPTRLPARTRAAQ